MSGMTKSTPSNSDSGNIMPASMTMISSPSRSAIMFMPNSPRPPRGTAVRDCEVLLNEASTPGRKRESYHRTPGSHAPRALIECKPPLWCLTKCGDWRYSSCVSCSVNTTRRRLLHVTNFTRTARRKRCRSQSGPCQDRGYAPGISERDVRKVWKADLSLCQVRIARTRSELAFDADRGRQDRGPEDPLRTSGSAIEAAGGRVQALS